MDNLEYWKCPRCGNWVILGSSHLCDLSLSEPQRIYSNEIEYLQKIIDLLEEISHKLEE